MIPMPPTKSDIPVMNKPTAAMTLPIVLNVWINSSCWLIAKSSALLV